jgi:hypothetical protein
VTEDVTTLQILYHGNCFDGVVSAGLFARFLTREGAEAEGAELSFRAMGHGMGDPYGDDHDATFWADINAVVDFRYSPSERLNWWADHHFSAFIVKAHRKHFEARPDGERHLFDPKAPSCAGMLSRWLEAEHGFDVSAYGELIRWADIIDSAGFESPAQAVKLAEPALQLMTLLESGPDDGLVRIMLEGLADGDLEGVHGHPRIQAALVPVLAKVRDSIALFEQRLVVEGGVAYLDLCADGVEGFNKFIPYHLADDLRYTVVLTCSDKRAKISVGSNPWDRPEPLINIAELCAKYGGGGHPVVGAVSMPPGDVERAREAAEEMAAVLRGE